MVASKHLEVCIKCVLDTHDVPDLQLDAHGVCQYCRRFEKEYLHHPLSETEKLFRLDDMIRTIQKAGKGKKYNCILVLSQDEPHAILAKPPVPHHHYRTIGNTSYPSLRRWVKLGKYYTASQTWKRKMRSLLRYQ